MGKSNGSAEAKSLMTPWGRALEDQLHQPLAEYPRPQLRRKDWMNLNGSWRCRIISDEKHDAMDMLRPRETDCSIRVPFCLESTLGGVARALGESEELWYHRTFEVKELGDCRWLGSDGRITHVCPVLPT